MTGYNDFASLICSGLVCSCAQTEDSYSNPKVIKFRLSHLSFSNQNLTKPESRIKRAQELSLSQGTAKDILRRDSGCIEDNLGNIGQHVLSLRTKLHCSSRGFPVSSGLTKIVSEKVPRERRVRLHIGHGGRAGSGRCVCSWDFVADPGLAAFSPKPRILLTIFSPLR